MNAYPEHERLTTVAARSRVVAEFLEWLLEENGCEIVAATGERFLDNDIQVILARYFGIDQGKLDGEKAEMVDYYEED